MSEEMPPIVDGPLRMVNTLKITMDGREEYLAALAEILPQAREQETCVYLEVGEVVGEPGTFVLNELWLNGGLFVEEVLPLPFYQRYIERCEPLYAAPRSVRVLNQVEGHEVAVEQCVVVRDAVEDSVGDRGADPVAKGRGRMTGRS